MPPRLPVTLLAALLAPQLAHAGTLTAEVDCEPLFTTIDRNIDCDLRYEYKQSFVGEPAQTLTVQIEGETIALANIAPALPDGVPFWDLGQSAESRLLATYYVDPGSMIAAGGPVVADGRLTFVFDAQTATMTLASPADNDSRELTLTLERTSLAQESDHEIAFTFLLDGVPAATVVDSLGYDGFDPYTMLSVSSNLDEAENRWLATGGVYPPFFGTGIDGYVTLTDAHIELFLPYFDPATGGYRADGGFDPSLHERVIDLDSAALDLFVRSSLGPEADEILTLSPFSPSDAFGVRTGPLSGLNQDAVFRADPTTNSIRWEVGAFGLMDGAFPTGVANAWRFHFDAALDAGHILTPGLVAPSTLCFGSAETGKNPLPGSAFCSTNNSVVGAELPEAVYSIALECSGGSFCDSELASATPSDELLWYDTWTGTGSRDYSEIEFVLQVPGNAAQGTVTTPIQVFMNLAPDLAWDGAVGTIETWISSDPADYDGGPDSTPDDVTAFDVPSAGTTWQLCSVSSGETAILCDWGAGSPPIAAEDVTQVRVVYRDVLASLSTYQDALPNTLFPWMRVVVDEGVTPSIDGIPAVSTSMTGAALGAKTSVTFTRVDGTSTVATTTDTVEVSAATAAAAYGEFGYKLLESFGTQSPFNTEVAVGDAIYLFDGVKNEGTVTLTSPAGCAPVPVGLEPASLLDVDGVQPQVFDNLGFVVTEVPAADITWSYVDEADPAVPDTWCWSAPDYEVLAGHMVYANLRVQSYPGVDPCPSPLFADGSVGQATAEGYDLLGAPITHVMPLNTGLAKTEFGLCFTGTSFLDLEVTESPSVTPPGGSVCYDLALSSPAYPPAGGPSATIGSTEVVLYQWLGDETAPPLDIGGGVLVTSDGTADFAAADSADAVEIYVSVFDDPERPDADLLALSPDWAACGVPCDPAAAGLAATDVRWVAFEMGDVRITDSEPRGVAPLDGAARVDVPYSAVLCVDDAFNDIGDFVSGYAEVSSSELLSFGDPGAGYDVIDVCVGDDLLGDSDLDGLCDDLDLCPGFDDGDDQDGDGVPDGCDLCPLDPLNDEDGDGVCFPADICPGGDDTVDTDGDGVPDDCDACPLDVADDSDLDGVCDSDDLCPGDDLLDTDGDGVADGCDLCPLDVADDTDGDGVCDGDDQCPGSDDLVDGDLDGVADDCDLCPLDPLNDSDGDGVCDSVDLCPGDDFLDTDGDGVADGCDPCPLDVADDSDGDGVCDSVDACPGGDDALDFDGDGVADDCDPCPLDSPDDTDGDGVCDSDDLCPGDDGLDTDGDGVADGCDLCPLDVADDTDGDGVCDGVDACPGGDDLVDFDGDGVADDCDPCPLDVADDSDGDGVCDGVDVCPGGDDALDFDGDGTPDDCDLCPLDVADDSDGDGVCDGVDRCPGGNDNSDFDGDGVADFCDLCPLDDPNDTDGDGVCDSDEDCFGSGVDTDGDGLDDNCDRCPLDNPNDTDGDLVCDSDDICPGGNDNVDADNDGTPDDCDDCPLDPTGDTDGDGVCDGVDLCPGGDDDVDTDGDGVADFCDPCPLDNPDDTDGDGVCDSDEACVGSGVDTDGDGVDDNCDPCPLDNPDDTDGDGVCDSDDLCVGDDQVDTDFDGVPDDCDPCPLDNPDDSDGDGVCDSVDLCDGDDAVDTDGDGTPDDCDPCPSDATDDTDGDGVCDGVDLCDGDDAVDTDGDGVPDDCDVCDGDDSADADGDGTPDACEEGPAEPVSGHVQGGLACSSAGGATGGLLPLALVMLLLGSRTARAQDAAESGVDAHGLFLVPSDGGQTDPLTLWNLEPWRQGSAGAAVTFEYAEKPLVFAFDDGTRSTLVDDLWVANVTGMVGAAKNVAFGLSAPLYFSSRGADLTAEGAALGDIRLSATAGKVEERGFGIGGTLYLDTPAGATGRSLGTGAVSGGASVPVVYGFDRVRLLGNLGLGLVASRDLFNVAGGPALRGGVGGAWEVSDRVGLLAEARLEHVLKANEVALTETPSEVTSGVRLALPGHVQLLVGGATALTRGATAAQARGFLQVGWGNDRPPDTDGDGLVDPEDACPLEPEVVNGYKDEEGCPDQLARLIVHLVDDEGAVVTDATVVRGAEEIGRSGERGIFQVVDLMPGEEWSLYAKKAHMADAAVRTWTLREGDNEGELTLPWLPGRVRILTKGPNGPVTDAVASFQGPATVPSVPIRNGDELTYLTAGDWSVFVAAPSLGTERRDVQIKPDETSIVVIEVELAPEQVAVKLDRFELKEKVFFDFDKATIQPVSFPLLDEVANNLIVHAEVKKVEIGGHTDSKGSDTYNQKLSQARVDSVRTYLISKGVAPERLAAVGYGERKPIADNATAEGREQNRRVELLILEQTQD